MSLILRDAAPGDVVTLLRLVRELAAYEKLTHEAVASEADFARALFGEPPRAYAMLAEIEDQAVGMAIWFFNFSTFTGRPGLFVEDVFVQPAHRGQGIGRALFGELARRAIDCGCARMQWSVLDWNAPAIHFYRGIGARAMDEWTDQRLDGDALVALAGR